MRAEYGVPHTIPPGVSPNPVVRADRSAEAPGSATECGSSSDPILNLHHPDLPSRLEDPVATGGEPNPPPNATSKRQPDKLRRDSMETDLTEGAPDWQ